MQKKWKGILLGGLFIIGIITYESVMYQVGISRADLSYSREYDGDCIGAEDAEFFKKRGKEFEIGANSYGEAVFKKPNQAFRQLKKEYSMGIELIRKEYRLRSLSMWNYEAYGRYGCQVETGTEEEKEQAAFVASFMAIFKNSYSAPKEMED